MSNDEIELIGKKVRDMYGTFIGKVVGTITDIDGSIQTVGIDCGSEGLRQIRFEQLVVQNDVVIYIPKWRLDSQKLLREKGLTLRRLKALIDLVSQNDDMKESAEMLHEKYKSKTQTTDLVEHITHEKAEISNVQKRLDDLSMEVETAEAPREQIQDSAVSYLNNQTESEVQSKLPEAPTGETQEASAEPVTPIPANSEQKSDESNWLSRMEAQ
jgi:DNA-binding transcriptional MerR regulator